MGAAVPSTEKGRRVRARIVGAAAEIVAERGIAAMSLDEVGERAEAGRSQLYHYFDDKADLVHAVIGATCDTVLGAQEELFEEFGTWAGIRRWMDRLIAIQVEHQGRGGCPIGSLAGQIAERDPIARAALADGLGRWEVALREGLTELRRRGRLRAAAGPAELAAATLALVQGGLLLTQVHRDPDRLRTALDAAWRLLRAEASAPRRGRSGAG